MSHKFHDTRQPQSHTQIALWSILQREWDTCRMRTSPRVACKNSYIVRYDMYVRYGHHLKCF